MAKKAKSHGPVTIIDEEGYETDGMFKWGGPKKPFEFEDFSTWAEDWNREFLKPASERIAGLREYLTGIIQPHVDGPIDRKAFDSPPPELRGRTITYLSLSTKPGAYAIREGVPKHGYFNDAVDALRSLDELSTLVENKPPNVDRIVRVALQVGTLVTRSHLRAYFAPEVLLARKRRKASAKAGAASAKWNAEIEALARPLFAKAMRGRMSETAASRRTSAELKAKYNIEFSARTIKRRLGAKSRDNA